MLTDTVIRAAKLFDQKGLVVMPSGGRLRRFKYRFPSGGPHRKEKLLGSGPPEVSLEEARVNRNAARTDLIHGIDPAVRRKSRRPARPILVSQARSRPQPQPR
jgi:hypothetical protein